MQLEATNGVKWAVAWPTILSNIVNISTQVSARLTVSFTSNKFQQTQQNEKNSAHHTSISGVSESK